MSDPKPSDLKHWYDRLNEYFPVEEMKSREHLEILLRDKPTQYRKDEGPNHVMLYVDFPEFSFVDYVFVSQAARGQGLGAKLLGRLKALGKPILLEVEPLDYEDSDTVKRARFYEREGFRHAERVVYERPSLATGQRHPLEILVWTPEETDDEAVYDAMRRIYLDIHCHRDEEVYGEAYDPVDEVLRLEPVTATELAA